MKKTVLLYNFDDKELPILKRAIMPLHFGIKVIVGDDIYLPVGYLAGITDNSEKRVCSGEISGKLVVMGGFGNSDIDKLILAMRKAGFGREVLKAVITPVNSEWCGVELYNEVNKEHEMLSKK